MSNDVAGPDGSALSEGFGPLMQVRGFACVMRDDMGREFLAVQTFGDSRGKAKRAALAMNSGRIDARKPALEMLRVCEVGVRVLQGQPPVDNRFVADGCERFGA